ncbi:MAG: response regulator, partial [bacterium]
LISGMALLMACLAIVINDFISLRSDMASDLRTLAEIIGTNSTAALRFDNEEEAAEILQGLKAKKQIIAACIYSENNTVFARYVRDGKQVVLPAEPKPNQHEFRKTHLALFHEIFLGDEKIGTLYIQSDLGDLHSRLTRYAVIVLVVLTGSILAAFLMTSRLQRHISEPILNLARTAKIVSDKKDFSVRAIKNSHDELGFLTERFNEMLSQIQARDDALQGAHDTLEKQAKKLKIELKERKRAEFALRISEERFKDLFDNAPDMYIILDPNGGMVDFNQRVTDVLGYAFDELVGKSLNDIVHSDDQHVVHKFIVNFKKSEALPKNTELRLIHKKGPIVWVSNEFSLSKDPRGKLDSVRVICRNITEKKSLQEELERARRLETAGRIAGQISHDFNNLLGPLAAYPALIRDEIHGPHSALEMLEEMESAAKKIAQINQQLLALGRRGHYKMEPIDLNALIENVTISHAMNHQTIFDTELASELFTIKGGAAQLSRALTNLILNADEAMHGKGIIRVKTRNVYLDKPLSGYQSINRGEYVRLDISDTGPGIKPDILDKIFDPFFSTKRMDRMRGSGLGLSVVHGIIEDHDGYITVKSQVKSGTTFSLYFPVARDAEVEVQTVIEKIEGGEESVLIVDDDPMQRRVTGQLLRRLGYHIHTVNSGEQAVDYVKERPQDLLLLDMVMDGIDGTETLRQILEFQPTQKALVWSGYARTNRVRQALKMGASGFVTKPISLGDLAVAVRNELDRS